MLHLEGHFFIEQPYILHHQFIIRVQISLILRQSTTVASQYKTTLDSIPSSYSSIKASYIHSIYQANIRITTTTSSIELTLITTYLYSTHMSQEGSSRRHFEILQ